MKLVINFDLIDTIKNSREPFNAFKIIRNNKHTLIVGSLAMYLINKPPLVELPLVITTYTGIFIIIDNIFYKILGDKYAEVTIEQLKMLVPQLNYFNIATDYDLLLQSELYKTKYKIQLNNKKIPTILQSKYILVPTYTYNGDIKDTSILQEHVIGSQEYVLSIGLPKKSYKFAYSGI